MIPIPNGGAIRWDYRLDTDWMPMTRGLPVWRTGKRLDDDGRWEEAVIGQRGGRLWEVFAEGEFDRTFATTGRNPAGSGGVGEGFESSVFVGGSFTADLDVEFTPNGPRIVLALAYYPIEGIAHHYGWSLFSDGFVQKSSWYFDEDDLRALYYWPRLWVLMYAQAVRRHFDLT